MGYCDDPNHDDLEQQLLRLREQKRKLMESLKEWLYEVPDGRFRPHHWKAIIYKSREALAEAEGRE